MIEILIVIALGLAMLMKMAGRFTQRGKEGAVKITRRIEAGKKGALKSLRTTGVGREGIPMDDCDYREGDVTAVDTLTAIGDRAGAAQAGFKVGTAGREFLTSLTISIAGIMTKGTGVLTGAIWVELSGGGLAKGGNYKFPGAAMTVQVDSTENAASYVVPSPTYPLAIALKDGRLDIKAGLTGDDVGTVTVVVTASFASRPTPGGLIDMDLREGSVTAVNVEGGMTVLGADTLGDMDVPEDASQLAMVLALMIPDPPTTLAEVQFSAVVHLQGTGFNTGGDRYFGLEGINYGGDTAGSTMTANGPKEYGTDIPVKDGQIHAGLTMLGTDPGGMTALVGLGYV